MKKTLKKRLHSQTGETISEVLISLLIAALALTMLATMISSTVSQVTASKENMNRYYEENTKLELQSSGTSATLSIQSADGKIAETQNVTVYLNDFFENAGKQIYAFTRTATD